MFSLAFKGFTGGGKIKGLNLSGFEEEMLIGVENKLMKTTKCYFNWNKPKLKPVIKYREC